MSANKIGYVGVNALIIDGSLRENLLYGNDDNEISDEKLINLLRELNYLMMTPDLNTKFQTEAFRLARCKKFVHEIFVVRCRFIITR